MVEEWIAEGDLVGLRPVTDEDADMLYGCWHDIDVQRNMNVMEPNLPLAQWWAAEAKKPKSWLKCAVVERSSGKPAGFVSLGPIVRPPELLLVLLPEFRGKGLGLEASQLMIDYGFGVMKLDSIGARALDSNPASRRLLDRLGFTPRPEDDSSCPSMWGVGRVYDYAYRLDRSTWERKAAA